MQFFVHLLRFIFRSPPTYIYYLCYTYFFRNALYVTQKIEIVYNPTLHGEGEMNL